MGVSRHRSIFMSVLFFLMFTTYAATTRTPTHRKLGGGTKEDREVSSGSLSFFEEVVIPRRRLGGLGSSPPSCKSKCGACSPCSPVHVPVHPGFTIPLEYYPEAWRCKCRNKMYMP